MIYTSYFGRLRSNQFKHLVDKGVSIARGNKYWNGKTYPQLFPSWDLITKAHEHTITEQEYKKIYYKEVLNKLDPKQVYNDLDNCILLCWETIDSIEKGKAFCHRHMVAEWLQNNGFEVCELK